MTSRPALFLGGFESPELKGKISDGRHPRVEYTYLMDQFDMNLFSFADVNQLARGPLSPLQVAVRRLSPYWGLGVLGRAGRSIGSVILATGEDIGLPLALLQRLTGGRREIAIITHGSYLKSPKFRRIAQILRSSSCLRFLCLSESLRRQLIEEYRFPERQVYNVGYGVDTKYFAPDTETET
ncbi:MAG: hypothetical protein V4671_11895, partial [Armatimonadota bacterium]